MSHFFGDLIGTCIGFGIVKLSTYGFDRWRR